MGRLQERRLVQLLTSHRAAPRPACSVATCQILVVILLVADSRSRTAPAAKCVRRSSLRSHYSVAGEDCTLTHALHRANACRAPRKGTNAATPHTASALHQLCISSAPALHQLCATPWHRERERERRSMAHDDAAFGRWRARRLGEGGEVGSRGTATHAAHAALPLHAHPARAQRIARRPEANRAEHLQH